MSCVDKSKEMVHLMKKYSPLFMPGDQTFDGYCRYFLGFFSGLEIAYGIKLERSISRWYQSRAEIKAPNVVWMYHLELCNKESSDEEKSRLLLDTLEDYFTEDPDNFGSLSVDI